MVIKAKLVKADSESMTAVVTGLENERPYNIRVVARNQETVSRPSNEMEVVPHPSSTPPPPPTKMALRCDRYYEDDAYWYGLFYSGDTVAYEALRTEDGADVEFEVLLVGAGGSGKGQTVTLGKGGDGGGGELVIGKLPPAYPGSIFVSVPKGGTWQTDTPANTTVKEGSVVLTARAGKSATDKNNGAGYPKQQVPKSWSDLSMFTWLLPGSDYVGGVATAGEQNFPDATFCGEGGAGTNGGRPGKGQESYVAIRWKK